MVGGRDIGGKEVGGTVNVDIGGFGDDKSGVGNDDDCHEEWCSGDVAPSGCDASGMVNYRYDAASSSVSMISGRI